MNLNPATLWWLMAGVTVAIELLSGTFYLLMLAIGMAAGAVAAHMGLGLTMQIVTCAVVGASTVLAPTTALARICAVMPSPICAATAPAARPMASISR